MEARDRRADGKDDLPEEVGERGRVAQVGVHGAFVDGPVLVSGAHVLGEELLRLGRDLEEDLVQHPSDVVRAQELHLLPAHLHRGGHLRGRLHAHNPRLRLRAVARYGHRRSLLRLGDHRLQRCLQGCCGGRGRRQLLATKRPQAPPELEHVAARHAEVGQVGILDLHQGLEVVEAVLEQRLRVLQHVALGEELHHGVVVIRILRSRRTTAARARHGARRRPPMLRAARQGRAVAVHRPGHLPGPGSAQRAARRPYRSSSASLQHGASTWRLQWRPAVVCRPAGAARARNLRVPGVRREVPHLQSDASPLITAGACQGEG
mmetsp:Transcript_47512/g.122766  ORF Transcript_47512/g.122766 Transcript_47512/m.122766 type:complete len:320 (+) Transcript_47512:1861-2820(+)